MKKLSDKKGFTLMEMLIVVAIIAVLVAIAVPTFTSALDKAQATADEANIRAYYAECTMKIMLEETNDLVVYADKAAAKTGLRLNKAPETWSVDGDNTLTITYGSKTWTIENYQKTTN